MKKPLFLLLIFILIYSCGPKQDKVDRIIEDGVEVIVNHVEPYEIEGELSNLVLEEQFVIDLESEYFA